MDQAATLSTTHAKVSLFAHILFAGALLVGVFVLGFFLGKSQGPTTVNLALPNGLNVSLPDGIQISGLPNEKVGCLEWVNDHIKDPKAGVISLICNGKSGL
ncbi:MAG: hypothetical protein ACRES7_10255 [Gammaproteobacteria bacterium]